MPVFIRALTDNVTLTAIRLDGGDVVLQEKGDRYSISDEDIDDNLVVSEVIKTSQEAGTIRVVVDRNRGINYGALDDAINDQQNFKFLDKFTIYLEF